MDQNVFQGSSRKASGKSTGRSPSNRLCNPLKITHPRRSQNPSRKLGRKIPMTRIWTGPISASPTSLLGKERERDGTTSLFHKKVVVTLCERKEFWPDDFYSHGDVKPDRTQAGPAVIVQASGLPWCPMYRGYIALCGERGAVIPPYLGRSRAPGH